jgi:TRAP transporter TAXI family solute receptor
MWDRARLVSLSIASLLVSSAAQAQVLSIVTTPPGSYTHSVAAAVAKVMVEHAGLRATVSPQQSHGHEAVNDGSADLSLATLSDVYQYVTGTVDWAGKGPKKNIRIVARMAPITTAAYVRLDSSYKSMEDLKGKRVPSGFPAQKAVDRVTQGYLASVGMKLSDVVPVPARNIVSSADDFAAGKTDVFWFALGSGKVKQVAASVGGLRALPVGTTPEGVKAMSKFVEGSYPIVKQPSPENEEIRSPIPIMGYDVVFFARADLPEETIYKLTRAMHDNKKDMEAVFAGLEYFEPERMATEYEGLEYHAGAIKFYKEKNLWPPKPAN